MSQEGRVDGVRFDRATPASGAPAQRPALVLVHGGNHGSWCWERYLPRLADAGWDCLALNWYQHGGSAELPLERFVRRSIGDVAEEIGLVAGSLERPPVLVGHSMGGLACQKYAEQGDVAGMVLLTPVVPAEVGGPVVEVPFDPSTPFGPPPFEMAREMFFQGASEEDARRYHALLCPESPKAVEEATRWTLSVDRTRISCPILVLGGELDGLVAADNTQRLAAHYDADYTLLPGRGHNVLLEPGWRETADLITGWLDDRFPA